MRITKDKPKITKKTITRKAEANLDHMAIVKDYADGIDSLSILAKKYDTSEENISLITTRFWKTLTNMRESRCLTLNGTAGLDAQESLRQLQHTEIINEEFLRMISEDHVALLSEAESVYSWVYVHTGNALEAMKTSGLDAGLYKDKERETRLSYDRATILRSLYLNSKPNVAAYIKEIRETRFMDMDIGKAKIQSELIDQLEYMKSSGDPRAKRDILRCIELLGKTVGAFTERIEISEISPTDSLDALIELATKATVKEITS